MNDTMQILNFLLKQSQIERNFIKSVKTLLAYQVIHFTDMLRFISENA